MAKMSAMSSTGWRLEMWKSILPEVPRYLLLGKGYGFTARELAVSRTPSEMARPDKEGAILAGDYHNGPLSVIIPFGIAGLIGFLWFLWAGLRVTYQNYKFGNPAYSHANTYIFAFFAMKAIFFFTVFGGLEGDLSLFAGLVGLSVSLNGGVAKPAVALEPEPKPVFNRFKLHPSVHRPVGV